MIITKSDNSLSKIYDLIKDKTDHNFDELLNKHVFSEQADGSVCKAFTDQYLNIDKY